ncbi:hypothetical protein L1987_04450 [Smallanthus sonchifolius]|uniref:Uncharacterized protein n=1 Tax=Smallanthus sonchifolius TaxID=185202 RepID=A0ACB9KDH1_9ASTR|nr:hypothetical protein L1987_04450 [Smallanthus sonchifolius]
MEGDLVGNKRGREDDKGMGRLEKRPSVLEEYSYSYSSDEMINGVKYEEEKETPGLFNQLITNLVNRPNQEAKESEEGEECTSDQVVEDEKDDSIIDNIVARLPRTLSGSCNHVRILICSFYDDFADVEICLLLWISSRL